MAKTNFTWGKPRTLITYDLSNNEVSASEIAKASGGLLHTYVTIEKDSHKYMLPNTTLCFAGSKEQAKTTFINAFNNAKSSRSSCTISRLLITEIAGCSSYIED